MSGSPTPLASRSNAPLAANRTEELVSESGAAQVARPSSLHDARHCHPLRDAPLAVLCRSDRRRPRAGRERSERDAADAGLGPVVLERDDQQSLADPSLERDCRLRGRAGCARTVGRSDADLERRGHARSELLRVGGLLGLDPRRVTSSSNQPFTPADVVTGLQMPRFSTGWRTGDPIRISLRRPSSSDTWQLTSASCRSRPTVSPAARKSGPTVTSARPRPPPVLAPRRKVVLDPRTTCRNLSRERSRAPSLTACTPSWTGSSTSRSRTRQPSSLPLHIQDGKGRRSRLPKSEAARPRWMCRMW